jgi:ferric-dicitrate binding protein FerR (iron transport regulator)
MSDDYLWDRSGDDPDVAQLEQLLHGFGHRPSPLPPLPPRRGRRAWGVVAAAVAAIAAVAVVVVVLRSRRPTPPAGCAAVKDGFAFVIAGGPGRCNGVATSGGVLPVGAWLETPVGTTADVTVADIGAVALAGDSRLRLAATGAGQHRLELERGQLHAQVSAPPRLFVIDTPTATAIDLGCSYDLDVRDGRTRLRVTGGVVMLDGQGRSAYVTVGTEVVTVPGRGPGTPVAIDASAALVTLIDRYDRGDRTALPAVLAAAGDRDTVMLWNLLANADADSRGAILARLDEWFPRPEWILEDDVVAGKPDAINGLRDVLTSGVWLAPASTSPAVPDKTTPPEPGVWK